METETVNFILDIIIMIIIIIITIMLYKNNKRIDKINENLNERIEVLKRIIDEESK